MRRGFRNTYPIEILCVLRSCNGCVEPPAQDYSEGDINEDRHLTANSDRLSHFGRRMSLFQLTLILGGLLFREQEHREEHMNLGAAKQGGAENG